MSSGKTKELVEHIRTIHFFLIILCFGLISASFLSREGEVTRSLRQLREINNLVDNWNDEWLQQYAQVINDNSSPVLSNREWWIPAETKRPLIKATLNSPPWTLNPAPSELDEFLDKVEGSRLRRTIVIKKPESLTEFEKLWDALRAKLPIHRVTKVIPKAEVDYVGFRSSSDDITQAITDITTANIGTAPCNASLFVMANNQFDHLARVNQKLNENYAHGLSGVCKVTSDGEDWENYWNVDMPVVTDIPKEFGGQVSLIQTYRLSWDSGPFSRTFPELNKVTTNLRDLPFERLFTILGAEEQRSSEQRVEIFGTKFPTGEIIRWGIPVVLLIQLYLLMHLKVLSATIGPEELESIIPWTGIYTSKLARLGTAITAFLLPSAVLMLLVYWQRSFVVSKSALLLIIVAIVLSALIASLSCYALREVWKRLKAKA